MSENALQQAIDELAESISARSGEIEEARRLPADVAASLAQAGLFNMLKPEELGGHQVSPARMMSLLSDLAQIDASDFIF